MEEEKGREAKKEERGANEGRKGRKGIKEEKGGNGGRKRKEGKGGRGWRKKPVLSACEEGKRKEEKKILGKKTEMWERKKERKYLCGEWKENEEVVKEKQKGKGEERAITKERNIKKERGKYGREMRDGDWEGNTEGSQ